MTRRPRCFPLTSASPACADHVQAAMAAGVPLVPAIGRVIGTLLFGGSPLDSTSLGMAIARLAVVAGIAAWLPARRAASVDPLVAPLGSPFSLLPYLFA